jgi:phosphoheptose isomerase
MHASSAAEKLMDIVATATRLLEFQSDSIQKASESIVSALVSGRKLLLFGNGGSAASAQHVAAEFVGRFCRERQALPALALTTDSSVLTAIANDYGFEMAFARQICAFGSPGDVAIGISSSGKSQNVVNVIDVASDMGLTTIALTGGDGGELARRVDIAIIVPSNVTARIQECHVFIGHVICEWAETEVVSHTCDSERVEAQSWEGASSLGKKLLQWPELLCIRERWRKQGKQVVWTNGCFDLLHAGHVRALQAAKQLGDILVVGINSDGSVRQLKGAGRPLMPVADRAEILAALQCVDAVVIFGESTPKAALMRLKPEIHCKGNEYNCSKGRTLPEASTVASYGGRIKYLPMLPFLSTTRLIQQIRRLPKQDEGHDFKGNLL